MSYFNILAQYSEHFLQSAAVSTNFRLFSAVMVHLKESPSGHCIVSFCCSFSVDFLEKRQLSHQISDLLQGNRDMLHLCICTSVHLYIYKYVHLCICASVHLYICASVHPACICILQLCTQSVNCICSKSLSRPNFSHQRSTTSSSLVVTQNLLLLQKL